MGFRQANSEGRYGYARIWSITPGLKKDGTAGNFATAKLTTFKKVPVPSDGQEYSYKTDFQHGFVRLIGHAYEKAKNLVVPESGIPIQMLDIDVTTDYNANTGQVYTNFIVYDFKVVDNNGAPNAANKPQAGAKKTKPAAPVEVPVTDDSEDDLPF